MCCVESSELCVLERAVEMAAVLAAGVCPSAAFTAAGGVQPLATWLIVYRQAA
jgi:hypothetical protein